MKNETHLKEINQKQYFCILENFLWSSEEIWKAICINYFKDSNVWFFALYQENEIKIYIRRHLG